MNLPIKLCAFALAIVVGFVAGRSLRPSAPEPAAEPTADPTPVAPLSALPTPSRESKLTSWLELMRLEPDGLSTDDWRQLMDDTRGDIFLSRALVRRWAAGDPESCWQYLVETGNGWPDTSLAKIAAEAWAGRDPEAAIAALAGLDGSTTSLRRQRGELVSDTMEVAMMFDLDRGFALLPTAAEIGGHLMFSERWMTGDPGKVCRKLAEFLEQQPSKFTRTAGRAAGVWYRQAPEDALEWAKTQPHETRLEALDKIVEAMAEEGDYDSIRALASEVDSMMILQRVGQPLRKQLQREDPGAACQWVIENYDGRMMGAEIGNIINTTDPKKFAPADFAPFIEQIPGGEGKGNAAGSLFQRWAPSDFPAAADWMAGLDRRTHEAYAGIVASQWAHRPAAHQWLRAAPASDFADTMLRGALRKINDPEKAREFAATLPAARAELAETIIQERAAK